MNGTELKCPLCNRIINYNEISESPRALHVQLQNVVVVCSLCSALGKLHQLSAHICPKKTSPDRPRPTTTIVEVTPADQESEDTCILKAANLLKKQSFKHQPGDPIPFDIEQATDRWIWLKLQQGHKTVSLKTGGRVS